MWDIGRVEGDGPANSTTSQCMRYPTSLTKIHCALGTFWMGVEVFDAAEALLNAAKMPHVSLEPEGSEPTHLAGVHLKPLGQK